MSVTQKELAQKLNISQSLVARALNDYEEVSLSTRQLVQETARSLGYRPHRVGQALSTGKTNQIALCFPFLGSSFYNELVRQFEALARQTSYNLLFATFGLRDPQRKNLHLTADGAIAVCPACVLPSGLTGPIVALQNQILRPLVAGEEQIDRVQFDLKQAAFAAIDHLINQGFKRIIYVAPDDMMIPEELRFHAYSTSMKAAGLAAEQVVLPISSEYLMRPQSHQLLKKYFREKDFPDAIFCCNDDIAIGAYRALADLGHSIPGETAILGFDDLDDAAHLWPPLSSVHMPIDAACRCAWDMLMQRLADPSLPPQYESFSANLIIRESSLGKSLTAEDEEVLLRREPCLTSHKK